MDNKKSKCCRCAWIGADEEKNEVYDVEHSNDFGADVHTLRCPKCGCEEFYLIKPKTQIKTDSHVLSG